MCPVSESRFVGQVPPRLQTLVPRLWEEIKFDFHGSQCSPTLSSIQKYASFIQSLSIDHHSALVLLHSATTFPALASLAIKETGCGKPYDDPALVDFIQRHREVLKSVTTNQHAKESLLPALEDCPRLESPTVENQDYIPDPTRWIHQFEHLWSRLHTMSLEDGDNFGTPNPATATVKNWLRFDGPNRIRDLTLHFNQPQTISGFSACVVKQCPDLIRLRWYCAVKDGISPMERLVDIFQGDSSFGKKLEDITLGRRIFKNETFQLLMKSLVQLRCLNLCITNFDQESWTILRTTKPAHLKTLAVLNLYRCKQLPIKAIHQMLCEMPSLKIFVATAVGDKEMVEDPRPWVCLDMEELTLRLSLTRFSTDPSVRSLAIKRYLAQVGQLKRLEVLKHFLPSDEHEFTTFLKVKGGLDVLKNLRRLRLAIWAHTFTGENEVRWILENWPLLENPSRSNLQSSLNCGQFSKSDK